MTLERFFGLLTQITFLWVAGSTLLSWLRQRDQARLDIALIFASLAIGIIANDLQPIFPDIAPWLALVFFVTVLLQPYLLLRVARYFEPVPVIAQRLALVGMLVSSSAFLLMTIQPLLVVALVTLYFVGFEGYAIGVLLHGVRHTNGITRKRLRLASLGTILFAAVFALIFGLVLFGIMVPNVPAWVTEVASPALQLIALLSGLSYFFGFASPRWLRHTWQLDELHSFLQQTSGRTSHDRKAAFNFLATAATQAVGGATSAIAGWNMIDQHLYMETPGEPPLQVEHLETAQGSIGKAWAERRACVVIVPGDLPPELLNWTSLLNARAVLAVPIVSPLRQWGLLMVAVRYAPLFAYDDLELLSLLASQSAVGLDYSALVADLRVSNQSLEQRVIERTTELAKVNRALLTISECNQELVRAESEDELLERICEIIVEKGGYKMAWVGYAEHTADQWLHPVARAGAGKEFLDTARLTWGNDPAGQIPIGITVRTQQPFVGHIANGPFYEPWREEALKQGFAACLALPLLEDGKAFGGLGIFSDAVDAFDSDEVKLLVELANDLAFGISTLRTRAAHAQAEAALTEREASFRLLFDGNPVPMWVYDRETWQFLQVNEAAVRHYGYSREEFLKMHIADIRPAEEVSRLKAYLEAHQGELMLAGVWKHKLKNGHIIDVEIVSHSLEYGGRPGSLVVVQDVTERQRLESELRRSEALLQQASHMAKLGGWEVDMKTKAVSFSEETYRIHEMDLSETPEFETAVNFYAPEARPIITAAIEKSIQDGSPWDLVLPFITAKGNHLWVRSQGRAEFEGEGSGKLTGIFQDITERKLADDALRESEERFTKAFRASPVAMMMTYKGRFVDTNDSFLTLFGYEPHEVLDHTTADLNLFTSPTQQEELARELREKGRLKNYETTAQTKSGELLHVVFSTETVELNSERYNITIVFDITDRKRAEDKARRSAARLKALAEVSRSLAAVTFEYQAVLDTAVQCVSEQVGDLCAIRFLTEDGQWLEHAASYHPDPEVLRLQREMSMSSPQHISEGLSSMAIRLGEAVMMPEVSMEQLRATIKPEHLVYLDRVGIRSVMMAPLFDRGNITGVIVGTRDRDGQPYTPEDQTFFQDLADRVAIAITNARLYADLQLELEGRRRVEEQLRATGTVLERNNRELQDFAYVASHDLQEPLRKIQAFGDRLRAKTEQLDEQGRDYVERMQVASKRMQTLIEDLLTYSRVTTKAQPFREANLHQVALDVVNDLEIRIEQTNAKVELGPLPMVEADPVQMRQILQNLIGNGIKFHKPNVEPLVKVWSETNNGTHIVYVSDNGIGFDEKYLDRIFVPFQRLHGRNEYEGTGIGLAVVRKITERHNGTVTAISKPGEGATFIVTLPAHQSENLEGH